MKCIVIEDELPAQELVQKYIEQTSDIQCLGVFESISELHLEVLEEVDFILLDIQLPGTNGIEFLKNLEIKPKIIVTTAYRDYAIEAFEEAAVDYLLKPFSYQRFLKAIMRVQNSLSNRKEKDNTKELFVYADKTFFKIVKDDILYIKSEVDYVHIFYSDKKLLVQDSMNNWEQKLEEENFVRVHRSYLINFSKIDKVQGNTLYINNTAIPIGKTYKKALLQFIKDM